MKKKVKKKLSKKKIIIFVLLLILIVILISFLTYKYFEKEKIKSIKKAYNKYILIDHKSNLYDKNKNIVGKVYNMEYELESVKKFTLKNEYFKVKNTNYYVNYLDVKKIKNIKKDTINNNYVVFDKNVNTKKKINLYKENKKVLTLNNGINMPVYYMDDNYYYIKYLGKILGLKKDKLNLVDNHNSDTKISEHISVLLFDKIEEKSDNYNTIKKDTFKEIINKLKENGYYTIDNDTYELFLKGYINLKEKAILIMTNNKTEQIESLANELGIIINSPKENTKLNLVNKTTNKDTKLDSVNAYNIKSYSTIDNILKMAGGEDVVEKEPVISIAKKIKGVPVLNYHFFYDPTIGESCNEGICLTTQKFEEELKYIKDNGYKALTMDEFVKWIYGEIEVPEKSVLITIDDGAMGTGKHNGNKLIPLLEKYQLHATLFLITGWWNINNYLGSDYLEVQSHTYDMHNYGTCKKGQLVCANYDEVKADLQKSIDIIGNKKSFCYPFYSYDDEAINAIRDLGFKVAFAGGNRDATRSSNKYIVPRYPIHSDITMERFKNILG